MSTSPPVLIGLATILIGAVGLRIGLRPPWPAMRRRLFRLPIVGLTTVVLIAGVAVGGWGVAMARGDRSPLDLAIAPGIGYRRIARDEPRPQVAHVATIDLDDPCVGVVTTRPADDGMVPAETGTDFVGRTGAAISINAAFFYPFDEYPHWDSYPSSGDPVTAIGPVVIDGRRHGPVVGFTRFGVGVRDGRGWAGPVPGEPELAVPARSQIVTDGRVVAEASEAYPRTVAGVDLDTNQLVLVVADGKQPGHAEGMTYREVGQLLVDLGVDEAVELDGGGSATMAGTVGGEIELLSRPSHQRIPGRQRPVATHLGAIVDPDCR